MSEQNQRNKAAARAYWAWCDSCPVDEMSESIAEFLTDDVVWRGFAPLENTTGRHAVIEQYLAPLRAAFPDLTRQTHIAMGGASNGRADGGPDGQYWVGGTGYLCGTQTGDLWGIPARNRPVRLRWGEFLEFDAEGRIVTIEILIDVIDWLEQIDLSPLPTSRGVPFVYPAPTGCDGQLWTIRAMTAR